MVRQCVICGVYIAAGQRGTRYYCDDVECKRKRKRERHRKKLQTDREYRENQKAAQKRWSDSHPDYWRIYRANHPEYTERNRQQQRQRNTYRRKKAHSGSPCNQPEMIAKMETILPQPVENPVITPGRYQLLPLGKTIAKMDVITVELAVVT